MEALLDTGALPLSGCSRALLQLLQPLLETGVLEEERSGAGRRLRVHNADAARDFFRQRYPEDLVYDGASSRVAAVGRFRDTKALASDLSEMVLARAWNDAAMSRAGLPVPAAAATRDHGVFAFVLRDTASYALQGPCALVENPAVFACVERLSLPAALFLYGRGRASNRLLDWLGAQMSAGFTLLHLPDYDPVGLDEFTRLHARLGDRVQLHQPADLAERFARYSARGLLEKGNQRALLARLRQSPLSQVQAVVALIERHNAGLEQEALLL
jgi:hypothetical protein